MPKSNLAKKIEQGMDEWERLLVKSKKLIISAGEDICYLERHTEDGALVHLLPLIEESVKIITPHINTVDSVYENNPGTKYQQ